MNAWPTTVHGYAVIKKPIGDAGALPLVKPISLVLHTIEGSTDEAGNQVFSADPGIGPHFTVDGDSIYQLRSLDHRAGSLKGDLTNDPHAIQIEIAGFSKTKPWTLPTETFYRVAALMAYAADYHAIPLVRPNKAWKDDCSDITGIWASTGNSRRQWAASHWPATRGVWMHLEIPENDHWDCGALNVSDLVTQATNLKEGDMASGLTEAQAKQLAAASRAGYESDGFVYALTGKKPDDPTFTTEDPVGKPRFFAGYQAGCVVALARGLTPADPVPVPKP